VEGGLTVSEIGVATGVNPETAKSRLRYAVARLKQALAEAAPE
jgi:RNA polymerase sigma-70 factor (ECF subfamily)